MIHRHESFPFELKEEVMEKLKEIINMATKEK
jgi:hypothetical protein